MSSTGKLFQYYKKPTSFTILLLFLSLVVSYTIFSQSNGLGQYLFNTNNHDKPLPKSWVNYTLTEAASKIAQNNTLIVCTVSAPFLPLLNNWLISVSRQQNHINKVLVIAEDNTTLYEVNNNWPGHAVMLSPPLPISGSGYNFNSEGFYQLTSRRPHHLLDILELGYNVMYNDVDMVWLADPFPYMLGENDVYFTDDLEVERPMNHSHEWPKDDKVINMCSCMIYMRPTSRAKLLMKTWIEEIDNVPWSSDKKTNDQPAFNRALKKTSTTINMYLLPQTTFPCGFLYFFQRGWAMKYKGMQAIIHSNYIVGTKTKIQYLKNSNFWFLDDYLSESPLVKP